ncbi:hypothetical protein OA416_04380, partial [Paracoccaceae bacterium]|nr:hypothetical protein [Paracoccaceae bacterium]
GGIGYVSGIKCLIYIDDSGINAGATTIKTIEKGLLLLDMAKKHKLPLVHLVESAGANLMQYKVELWALGGRMISLEPIQRLCSSEIKDRVLKDIVTGEKGSSLGITEPGGGSDVANMKTSAKKMVTILLLMAARLLLRAQ